MRLRRPGKNGDKAAIIFLAVFVLAILSMPFLTPDLPVISSRLFNWGFGPAWHCTKDSIEPICQRK
jgi:hypothetical protein